jgi:hypothetical protein
MRLLEFNLDAGGANPQSKTPPKSPSKPVVRPVKLAKRPAAPEQSAPTQSGKVFPLNAGETPARARKPIDLEQLQQRIEILERRILARNGETAEHPASQDIELLKQRVSRLQQSVHAELWAARQREHTMLEILSKPSFKTVVKQRLKTFWSEQLPTAGRWLIDCSQQWWKGCQPGWWTEFAQAWQESLDKARGIRR